MTKETLNAELLDVMGSDLTVVNSARVSFDKHTKVMRDSDYKLLKYLAAHNHWSPFAHVQLQFRVTAPIFVARQLQKHTVGLVWNEISRRYVDSEPKVYNPMDWRSAPVDAKQGSGEALPYEDWTILQGAYETHCRESIALYNYMVKRGVCAEQARMVLPQSMVTSWYWTGSLVAFARVINLRAAKDTQWETQQIALALLDELERVESLLGSISALIKLDKGVDNG